MATPIHACFPFNLCIKHENINSSTRKVIEIFKSHEKAKNSCDTTRYIFQVISVFTFSHIVLLYNFMFFVTKKV